MEERLWFLLQPDLETLLRSCHLDFPRRPFPFQLEGMAFLMPRHAAVLADEMGLGKSMQAISSIRLLIHAGEARRVLVVCPKGLVSNWVRELGDWAPEIPVAVIEGDPQRRRWQWALSDVAVKVANYESVVRDRELIAELKASFDLVVLDEAQHFAAQHGLSGWLAEAGGTPVEWSFCQHTVAGKTSFVVNDTQADALVKDSPLVTQDGVRCYAGMPLITSRGHAVGALCVAGVEAREFTASDLATLQRYTAEATRRIETRRVEPRA
jgi:GAF domain-containing protein